MMKNMDFHKLTMMLLLSVISIPAGAQEQEEFYPTGTKCVEEWYYNSSQWGGREYTYFKRSTIGGDTIMDERLYKKLYIEEFSKDGVCSYHDIQESDWQMNGYNYYIREDSGKVYFRGFVNSYTDMEGNVHIIEDKLLYDYNWKVGGTLPCLGAPIEEIKQVQLLDGNWYDYVDSRSYVNEPYSCLILEIRTIGCVGEHYGLFQIEGTWVPGVPDQYYHVVSFERNGVLLYSYDDYGYYTSVDAPVTSPSSSGAIYDLHGRRLKQIPAHGVYIQDGRKHVR